MFKHNSPHSHSTWCQTIDIRTPITRAAQRHTNVNARIMSSSSEHECERESVQDVDRNSNSTIIINNLPFSSISSSYAVFVCETFRMPFRKHFSMREMYDMHSCHSNIVFSFDFASSDSGIGINTATSPASDGIYQSLPERIVCCLLWHHCVCVLRFAHKKYANFQFSYVIYGLQLKYIKYKFISRESHQFSRHWLLE